MLPKRLLLLLLLGLCGGTPAASVAQTQDAIPKSLPLDPAPRIGVLIPKGPPDYDLCYANLRNRRDFRDGIVSFQTGTVEGVPVVLTVQPAPGEVLRALVATAMLHDFRVRALLYPGTSGGHLPEGRMAAGDIVLGAENVNHGSYYLSPSGAMEAGEFNAEQPGVLHFGALFADPRLLSMLACSAQRVAASTDLPAWLAPVRRDGHPQIFFYGVQGTSEVWSDNRAFTAAEMGVFHDIDEDGDWYSNLAGTLFGVPFLEVSTISNSIFAYPARDHGTPATPQGQVNSHVLAQRISNRIVLDLLAHQGQEILSGHFTEPTTNPFPASAFEHPTEPGSLLATGGCAHPDAR